MNKKIQTIISLALVQLMLISCNSEKEIKPSNFTVAFLKGEAERVNLPSKLKAFDLIPESETVKTSASAVLDLATDLGSIRLLGETTVILAKLNQETLEFNVNNGNILVKSTKLQKGQTLRVSTPTVVAAVRGTEFWGQVNKETETGTFAVRDGAVEITRKSDNITILIEKGQALDIDPKAKDWKVRTAKQGELDAMAQIDEIK